MSRKILFVGDLPVQGKGMTMKSSVNKKCLEQTEEKNDEMRRYLNGLERYKDKGIPIYVDGMLTDPKDCEKIFEVHEDGMFYMGDYVQADTGELKEIRFDKVYYK